MNCIVLLLSQIVVFTAQPNIKLEVIGQVSDTPKWSFFAPHENENVAIKYVSEQIIERGGIFVILRQNGKRLLQLEVDPFTVKIDPNRIFTKEGRRRNIIKHNPKLRTNTYLITHELQPFLEAGTA